MANVPESDRNSSKIQFNLRALMILMTVACIVFGLLAWLLPPLPAELRVLNFASFAFVVAVGAWVIYRSKHLQWKPPKDSVTVKVDAKWLRRVKSKRIFLPIAALTGVSITFAPLFLFWCGKEDFGAIEWIVVPLCFVVIYAVPSFYMGLAGEVIAQLARIETPAESDAERRAL
jgi:hypothetical protein